MPERPYPIRRYVSSRDRFLAPHDALTDSSSDVEYNTRKGSVRRRRGHSIVGDTWGGSPAGPVTGLLESAWGAVCRQISSLTSDALDDGYPTHAALFTKETEAATFGEVYVRSTGTNSGGANNYTLGEEYGTTHYADSNVTTASGIRLHAWPLFTNDITSGISRLQNSTHRRMVGNGARRGMLEAGNWMFIQGQTPIMWNKQWNDSTSSGSNINRIRCWGHPPPLIMPNFAADDMAEEQNDVAPWKNGTTFYTSVMFQFEDGSWGQPILPREPNDYNTAGLGKVTIPGTNGLYRDYITWSNIPIGPVGVKARALLRTRGMPYTATDTPAVSKLFICGVINDNATTTYRDSLGSDDGLIDDPDLVRFDHTWAPRAQYVTAGESRILLGGRVRPHLAGIVLAPSGSAASRDMNVSEDTAALSPTASDRFYVWTGSPDALSLYHGASTKNFSLGSTAAATFKTLQELCDEINATTVADNCKEWVAQVAPGTDPNLPAYYLLRTDGTGYFTVSTGDSAHTGGNNAFLRAFSPAFPAILYLDPLLVQSFDPQSPYNVVDDQGFFFSSAMPGTAAAAPMNFYFKNRRKPSSSNAGIYMGAAALGEMFVVCYSKSIYLFRNTRDMRTGFDDDYFLTPLNTTRGCIAWDSIVEGDGWVGYLTREGYVVTDGREERLISGDVYDAHGGATAATGDWVDEVAACAESVAAVVTTGQNQTDDMRFHAMVADSRLWVSYRGVGSNTESEKMVYDYSASETASGLAEVLMPDGTPWGWSPPHIKMAPGPMGKVEKAAGLALLAAHMVNTGTNDGGIVQFDTGSLDFASAIAPEMFGPMDTFGGIRDNQVQDFWIIYTKNGTGALFRFYRDIELATAHSITLPTTSTATFKKQRLLLPLGARGNAEGATWRISDTGASSNPLEVLGLIANYYPTMSEV